MNANKTEINFSENFLDFAFFDINFYNQLKHDVNVFRITYSVKNKPESKRKI